MHRQFLRSFGPEDQVRPAIETLADCSRCSGLSGEPYDAFGGASALKMAAPTGLPQPVQASHPCRA